MFADGQQRLTLQQMSADANFKFVHDVEARDLSTGLGRSMTLFRREALEFIASAKGAATWVFLGTLLGIAVLFGALFGGSSVAA